MIKIAVSTVIPAPVTAVWAKIRDFNDLPGWHPALSASKIEDGGPSDRVGCIRAMTLANGGGVVRERLLTLSDDEHYCTYTILDAPMPISNYVSTLRLLPITDGDQTYAHWSATFDCAPEQEAAMVELLCNGIYMGGFNTLKKHFSA